MTDRKRLSRNHCEKQASKILEQSGVHKWPVRVDHIAKQHGIVVRYEPLDNDLSGMIFVKDEKTVVGVNVRHNANRQRFTIAHELGHFVMHGTILRQGAHVDKVITMLKRDQDAARGDVDIEIEANQFAAELLMPKAMIKKYMDAHGFNYGVMPDEDAIEDMAKAFKVSSTAMAIRIGSLI